MTGSFYRAVLLPEGVKLEDVKATFSDGVLEVSVPLPDKPDAKVRKVVEIQAAKAAKTPAWKGLGDEDQRHHDDRREDLFAGDESGGRRGADARWRLRHLPVVEEGKLVGVVTDRDMYIALATRNQLASHVTVGDVARKQVFTCGPDDDVHAALAAMKQHRVRRLPVEGFGGTSWASWR